MYRLHGDLDYSRSSRSCNSWAFTAAAATSARSKKTNDDDDSRHNHSKGIDLAPTFCLDSHAENGITIDFARGIHEFRIAISCANTLRFIQKKTEGAKHKAVATNMN